jgi:hypothetical protein
VYVSHVVGVGGGGRGLELMGTATGAAVGVEWERSADACSLRQRQWVRSQESVLTLIKNETSTNRPQAVTNRLDSAHPAWLLKDTPLLRLAGEKMWVHAALYNSNTLRRKTTEAGCSFHPKRTSTLLYTSSLARGGSFRGSWYPFAVCVSTRQL